ncbi:MAG: hypothetical protein OHK0029_12420 [Armatimonadaceae bacterium]
MMRVLWINQAARLAGGCERYIQDTVQLLRERGVASALFYDVADTTDPEYTQAFSLGAFPVVDLPLQIAELAPDIIYVHRMVESASFLSAIRQAPVPAQRFIHDHKLFCPREHKYTVLGKQTCTRTVGWGCYPCLGVVNKVPASEGLIRLRLPHTLLREQQANREAFAGFVTGSGYMTAHLKAHGFPADRVHTIPLFTPEPADEDLLPVERAPDVLLFVGQLTTGKAVDVLLEAVARTQNPCRLRLVGTGKFEQEYRDLTARLGLAERVTFVGKKNGAELAREYRQASMVVFPSRTPETFGLVGPEAMSHGTPVIATAVGGMTEWLEDGVNGLVVPPNDVAALAQAIDTLLSDPQRRIQMGCAGKQRHQTRFTPAHHVSALLHLFEALQAGSVSRSRIPHPKEAQV